MSETLTNQVEALARRIDLRGMRLLEADRYYQGTQPLAYLSPVHRKALGDRLQTVGANYVRLATDSLAERLTVDGFEVAGEPMTQVWEDWQRSGMEHHSKVAILEALILGQSFLTVWAGADGQPTISLDSPAEMAATRHPLTREVTSALKRWRDGDGTARAVLFLPEKVTTWVGPYVPEGGALPSTGFSHGETFANPLGVVPVVDLTNSGRLHDPEGTPEARDIWALCDALAKLLADVMVASESTSLPRRWATGLAVKIVDGKPVNPFSGAPGSVWQSEKVDTKFGDFREPNLASYDSLITVLLRQIGSVSSLPDHYMGFQGAEPSSAEQIRAAESGIVAKAYSHHTMFGPKFARVAALCDAIRIGGRVRTDVKTVWKSPESRTVAQAADAAAKVVAAKLLSVEGAQRQYLGLTPEQIEEERRANVRDALDRAPLTLPGTPEVAA